MSANFTQCKIKMHDDTNEEVIKRSEQLNDSKLKRMSRSKSSIRHSFRSSKMKLDEFFKSPHLDFGMKRKRCKVAEEETGNPLSDLNPSEEPCRKKSALSRLSVSNLVSPIRTAKKVGDVLQKSFSISNLRSPQAAAKYHPGTPYRQPSATSRKPSVKCRLSSYWHETVDNTEVERLDKQQLDRQEAIFELYKSEVDLIEDLEMIKSAYRDSLKKLGLLTDNEAVQIFGQIDGLIPLHQDLVEALKDQRLPDGTTENVGQVLVKWVPQLQLYASYCSNQIYAKALLDAKKRDPAVEDFLQRCQESPFSRRLDLWSFLDVPRSRLVKYPLLFKSIQKQTSAAHEDYALIDQALEIIELTIKHIDLKIGQSKCQFTIEKLEFLDDKQKHPLIDESQFIVCDGLLKTSRGMKLHVFLFDKVLVLTRRSSRGDGVAYQVYRRPIPLGHLVLQAEGQQVQKESFKNAFSQSHQTVKHSFKVLSRKGTSLQSYVLQANDEQDRQHWLQSIQTAIESNRAMTADDDSFLPGPSVSRGSSFASCNEPPGLGDVGSFAGSLVSLNSMFSTDSYESGHTLRRTRAQMVGKATDVEENGVTKS